MSKLKAEKQQQQQQKQLDSHLTGRMSLPVLLAGHFDSAKGHASFDYFFVLEINKTRLDLMWTALPAWFIRNSREFVSFFLFMRHKTIIQIEMVWRARIREAVPWPLSPGQRTYAPKFRFSSLCLQ